MFSHFARRCASTAAPRRNFTFLRLAPATLALTAGGSLLYVNGAASSISDNDLDPKKRVSTSQTPITTLLRSYVVYTMCSIPFLVDTAPGVLSTLSAIPGVRHITEAIVRRTFFRQFVGGESAHETIEALRELRMEHRGAMLSHSVEVDLINATTGTVDTPVDGIEVTTPSYKRNVEESIKAIDAAADFEDEIQARTPGVSLRRTTVAIKLTAMVPSPDVLTRFSAYILRHRHPRKTKEIYPGYTSRTDLDVLNLKTSPNELTRADFDALVELRDDLFRLCSRAEERGVRVMVDAEYTWFQPAIDAFAIGLMKHFNRSKGGKVPQPLVYSTFQAYLKRTVPYLTKALEDAKADGYTLGVKLVRGAYHPYELKGAQQQLDVALEPLDLPPVHEQKQATDDAYNTCLRMLVQSIANDQKPENKSKIPTVGVLFGTHNWKSAKLVLKTLVDNGLATISNEAANGNELRIKVKDNVVAQVTVAQLYGMCEGLTQYLVDHIECETPMVIKCVPYGVLSEVMPYLGRRAIENKSVLGGPGGATDERRRVGAELHRRIFG